MFVFDDSLTLQETIEVWGAIISVAIAAAAFLQVAVTWAIARNVSYYSMRAEAVNASRQVNASWQEYNRLVVIDPEFRKTHRALEGLEEPDETTQVRYIIFMILNVLHDGYHASKAAGGNEHLDANVRELMPTLRNQKDLVLSILDGARGYDQEFVQVCKRHL